ncbi:MAG: hypothetical protein QOK80_07965 [Nitrososphaeraceae archaeon]|nr:hypothetical protein [Nitrososphaeraceae archaeon]
MINLDFNTRYTTVLKGRVTGRMVAIVDFNGDEGEIRYCEHCFKYDPRYLCQVSKSSQITKIGFNAILGEISIQFEAKFESKIKDCVETTDNPFDEGNEQVWRG